MAHNFIDRKVEKFIVERESFKKAVREAFLKADLDGNGVIGPREVIQMSDTMFDLVEKELHDYGIHFRRPTKDEVDQCIHIADKNNDFVLNQEEFFQFYRQLVKYCAIVNSRGFFKRLVPNMLVGLVVACCVKWTASQVPAAGTVLAPIPATIVGPLLGAVAALLPKDEGDEALKKKLFTEGKQQASGSRNPESTSNPQN